MDLRFADDILLFAGSAEQLGYMLDTLVTSLEKVGLKLNAAKTKALTTQAQPPKTLTTRAGLEIAVLDQPSSHKRGCVLSTENAGRRQDDIDHRLQSAARAFHVHKWILCDKMVSMASGLKFFDAMVTSVVCFAAGHRKIYTSDLQKLDVHCRKLLRRVVGPPADIDWNEPWHTILHAWHRRIDQQLEYHGFKMWSTKYLSEYWKFANYVALLEQSLGETHLALEPRRWEVWTSIFSMANSSTKIFAAGITYATGLTLPEAPIFGFNTTPTSFPFASDDVIFSRFRV